MDCTYGKFLTGFYPSLWISSSVCVWLHSIVLTCMYTYMCVSSLLLTRLPPASRVLLFLLVFSTLFFSFVSISSSALQQVTFNKRAHLARKRTVGNKILFLSPHFAINSSWLNRSFPLFRLCTLSIHIQLHDSPTTIVLDSITKLIASLRMTIRKQFSYGL